MDLNLMADPDGPVDPRVPDFDSWGESALLVAQSENLHSLMCTLSADIDQSGLNTGDPAIVNQIVNRLAGMSLTQADIIRSLSGRFYSEFVDAERTFEIRTALDAARRTLVAACQAAQAATSTLRSLTDAAIASVARASVQGES